MPICWVPATASAEEKQAMVYDTKNEYFNILASELDTTTEKVKEAYKKTFGRTEPMIIHVDEAANRTIL